VNPAVFATAFAVIFIGELPDKTMIASLVMSTRGRPAAVWLGAASAFTVHVVIAVTIGTMIFRLLPQRVVETVVAVLFGVGAFLAVLEARHERQNQTAVEEELAAARGAGLQSVGRTVTTAFVIIFLAEWGDLTQVLTANLAAHYRAPLPVAAGALLALWTVTALSVTGGKWLARVVNATAIHVVTAVVLAGLAFYTGWMALTSAGLHPS
jgi:Ca2+/H+ antiporter, TMEM165/GDT1 family